MNTASTQQRRSAEDALMALLSQRDLVRAEPAILQPAEIFLDLSGEDIRRRLYLVQDPEGREMCLRPDYTIPVSRDHLLARGGTPAGYCYFGPVFRYRPGQSEAGEFIHSGLELFGDGDSEIRDADVMAFALQAARAFGLDRPVIRLGDPGLFMAFVEAIGLPAPWPRRLRAAFGRPGGLADALSPSPTDDLEARPDFVAALAAGDPATALAAVEEMMAVGGIAPVGGRSAAEIAERLIEKAQLAAGGGVTAQAREVLHRAASVTGQPAAAVAELAAIAREAAIDVDEAIARFERRLAAMAERGVPVDEIAFSADFGRRLDYYTGYVFEVADPARPEAQIVGGGRYDRLLSMLGSPQSVPAVGCSIWVDRLLEASQT